MKLFSRIWFRASIPRESKRCNVDGRMVCGQCWKINHIFCQIRPLHHSQRMNFSAHPRMCVWCLEFTFRIVLEMVECDQNTFYQEIFFSPISNKLFGSIPWQVYFQRVLAAKTPRHAKYMSIVAAFGTLFIAVPAYLIGIGAASTGESRKDPCLVLFWVTLFFCSDFLRTFSVADPEQRPLKFDQLWFVVNFWIRMLKKRLRYQNMREHNNIELGPFSGPSTPAVRDFGLRAPRSWCAYAHIAPLPKWKCWIRSWFALKGNKKNSNQVSFSIELYFFFINQR